MRLKLYLIFAAMSFALQGCIPDAPGIYKNEKISNSKHNLFSKLNAQLFEALKANKPKDVEAMMSRELLNADNNRRTIELINLHTQSGAYNLLDEFYIIRGKNDVIKPLNSTALDGNKYTLFRPFLSHEAYIAFIIPHDKGDKYMITVIFSKYDYGWKLSTLDFKPYTMAGKTAPQLSMYAMQKFNKGYLVDAYLTMLLANECMHPSNLWIYPQNAGIAKFYNKVFNVINSYTYPLIIEKVPTKPKIFEVSYQTNDQGVFPVIRYISAISINNTVALKKENDNIKKVIGQMFLGIDKDKKYIYFSAYNQLPKPNKTTLSFDMTDTLQTTSN